MSWSTREFPTAGVSFEASARCMVAASSGADSTLTQSSCASAGALARKSAHAERNARPVPNPSSAVRWRRVARKLRVAANASAQPRSVGVYQSS